MPTVKMNISLDAEVANTLKRRARETAQPASRYLGELIERDARRAEDALAAEGYRLLSADPDGFVDAAWALSRELPWTWEEHSEGQSEPGAEGAANEQA